MQTGCRFGELARLIVSDFNSDTGTAFVQKPKSGKSRHVILTEEGVDLFARLCTGRAGNERILRREWYNSAATRNARDLTAREDLAANIVPRIEAHLGVACCDEWRSSASHCSKPRAYGHAHGRKALRPHVAIARR